MDQGKGIAYLYLGLKTIIERVFLLLYVTIFYIPEFWEDKKKKSAQNVRMGYTTSGDQWDTPDWN